MQELMIRPTIYSFDNCRQFAEEFKLGKGDLLFTNKRLFKKFFEPLGLVICPLSSRQVKYLKVSDKNTYISFWSVGIFMHTISLYIF